MRVLLEVQIPNEEFNKCVKDGTASTKMGRILEELNPEAAYFYSVDGYRGGMMVCNLTGSEDLPRVSEPWFLTFGAKVKAQICMTPADIGKSGLDSMGNKWG